MSRDEIKTRLEMDYIIHEDDKSSFKNTVIDQTLYLIGQGFEIDEAMDFVGKIVSATRDNYGD